MARRLAVLAAHVLAAPIMPTALDPWRMFRFAEEADPEPQPTPEDATPPAGAQNADKGSDSDATETEERVVPVDRYNHVANELRALKAKLAESEAAAQTAAEEDLARKEEWKTLAETRAEELANLKSEKTALELDALRHEVADAAKLPPALRLRIQGTTREEMEADATELAALIPEPAPGGTPFVRQGAGGQSKTPSVLDVATAVISKRYGKNGTAS